MTSSNVSNLLVQVSQMDVLMTSDKAAVSASAGLFEKTLKNVADKVPVSDSNIDSALPKKQVDTKQPVKNDTSTKEASRNIKQEEKPMADKTEVAEKVEAVVEEVKEVIKDQLDVTEEDIEKAMENLGLTFIDLLNPQSLAQLVSELTGETESITLILSDDFAGILDKVTELTGQLFEETKNSFIELKDMVVQTESTAIEQFEVAEAPEMEEIPEISKPEAVLEQEGVSEEVQSVAKTVSTTQEAVKPEEKQQVVMEDEASVVEDTKEVLKPVQPETNQQQKEQFQSEKKEEAPQEQFKVPEKQPHVEADIIRGEGIIPPQQQLQPQFIPEEAVVSLPTGETVKAEEIVNQLVEQAKIMTDSESTTMELTLNPEGLGKIYLEVTQKGEEITAKIFTENDAVKHALETQMANLRTEMNQSATKVTSIEVSVGTHEFERNLDEKGGDNSRNQEQNSGRSARRNSRINLNSLDDLSGMMTEEEMLIAQMMKDNGGTLDFMA